MDPVVVVVVTKHRQQQINKHYRLLLIMTVSSGVQRTFQTVQRVLRVNLRFLPNFESKNSMNTNCLFFAATSQKQQMHWLTAVAAAAVARRLVYFLLCI